MAEPNIALLRKGGEYLLALTRLGADNRWWATTAAGKPFRVTKQQFVLETDITVSDTDLAHWLESAEQSAADIDLEEAWKVVLGEVPGLSLTDLSELVWTSPVKDFQIGALLLCLYRPVLRYFQVIGIKLMPLSEEDVTAQKERQEKKQRSAEEESSFIAWLAGAMEPTNLTHRQLEWVEMLRLYVIQGDSSNGAKAAKGWLRQVQHTNDPQHLAFDLLVRQGELDEDEFLSLHRLGVPTTFTEEALAEADRLGLHSSEKIDNRKNFLDKDVFTIDEESTADIDDGFSVTQTPSGYEIAVHIADATALVPATGLIEDGARERMTSLYLPEVTLPMLPKQLSEVAGSLLPGEIRPAVSLLAQISDTFEVQSWEFSRSLVRSACRLSYEEADAALKDSARPYGTQLQILSAAAEPLHAARLAAGALEMDRPELKVHVDKARNIAISVKTVPTPARRLVAEFMVLMNNLIGKYLLEKDIPAIYRSQDPLAMEDIPDTSIDAVRQFHILRRIRPATLSTSPGPHALIGVEPYLQATSPLRRYADLINQRQLTSALLGDSPQYGLEEIKNVLFRADATLRDLSRVENDRQRYWILKSLSRKIGEVFAATVLDARDRNYVVEVESYLIRSNVYLRPTTVLGQTVELVLQEVDIWRQQAYFKQSD
ncbi:MAG: ribonuclease catalytic domain-containing protein [Chloroflexota bacterium]|nr:ribonuclease catalytic domain-containing protein [Chloroflexota bacterium]